MGGWKRKALEVTLKTLAQGEPSQLAYILYKHYNKQFNTPPSSKRNVIKSRGEEGWDSQTNLA